MTEYTQSLTFDSQSDFEAAISVDGSFAGLSNFVVSGMQITRRFDSDLFYIGKYVGERNVPHDIRQQRRFTSELMRRLGQPVIIKHMWNAEDEEKGLALKSHNWQSAYGQVRNQDPLSYGTGYMSKEASKNEWIAPNGQVIERTVSPGADFVPAPKYRGFGPGYLTYIIEPDAAFDMYMHTPQGTFIRVQEATAVTAWYPEINDNDLIINAELDKTGRVVDTHERYTAKRTNPVSIRGTDRRGRSEYSGDRGNAHVINQTFEMALVPSNNILGHVEIDR